MGQKGVSSSQQSMRSYDTLLIYVFFLPYTASSLVAKISEKDTNGLVNYWKVERRRYWHRQSLRWVRRLLYIAEVRGQTVLSSTDRDKKVFSNRGEDGCRRRVNC